jgi:two-component system sensor histidine kinase YesM
MPTTIRSRLLLSFGAIIALLSIFSALVFSSIQQTHRFLAIVQGDIFGIAALSNDIDRLYAAADNYLHSGRSEYLAEYEGALTTAFAEQKALRSRLPGDLPYEMHDIGNMIRSFDELEKQAVIRFAQGAAAIYVGRDVAELGRLRSYTRSECSRALSQYMVSVNSRVGAMRAALARNETLAWMVLLLATAASVFLALRVTTGISRPIHSLVLSLRDFAEGRLDTPPLARGVDDEIALLVDSYNDMTARIRGYVEEIRVASKLEAELKRQEIRSLQMENALKQSELETLQSRINPHFLFNTLNTIASLAEIEDAARTKSAVSSMAILLRAQLDSARSALRLDRELESVEHYLRIQEIRFGSRLRHELRVASDAAGFLVPGMIVQPFVENAVIHGIEPLERGGVVRIEAKLESSGLLIAIVDDGAGFDTRAIPDRSAAEAASRGMHEGISNVSRRLELLYGVETVFIESAPGAGTTVTLRLPGPCPRLE